MNVGATCEKKDPKKAKKSPFQPILPLEEKDPVENKNKNRKVILLAGPTGCGKTALSLMLADAIKGEIISADSMQVYRGMDIGTAKVNKEEMERIPHHLIDIRDIQDSFNVVDFYYEARQCCESILARGKVPIIVGGSGFYFRSLLYGPPSGPPSISDVRESIENEMKLIGSEPLYDKLKELDPVYAATITNRDRHKIVRALEIITLTGEKVSKFSWKRDKTTLDYQFHCWFLYRPREALYPRIEARCEKMVQDGLIEEVSELEKKGLRLNLSASQAIGYKQCLDYLQTEQTPKNFEEFMKIFKTASKQYAKRQFTWFRKEPLFKWLNVEVHDFEIALDMIVQEFEQTI